jgi:hypothetical protein
MCHLFHVCAVLSADGRVLVNWLRAAGTVLLANRMLGTVRLRQFRVPPLKPPTPSPCMHSLTRVHACTDENLQTRLARRVLAAHARSAFSTQCSVGPGKEGVVGQVKPAACPEAYTGLSFPSQPCFGDFNVRPPRRRARSSGAAAAAPIPVAAVVGLGASRGICSTLLALLHRIIRFSAGRMSRGRPLCGSRCHADTDALLHCTTTSRTAL